jgi:hypothetical protein
MARDEHYVGGTLILAGFGAICVVLVGLVVFEPKVGVWVATAAEAEFSKAPDHPAPIRLSAEPTRRPIQPTAWADIVAQKVEIPGFEQAQK